MPSLAPIRSLVYAVDNVLLPSWVSTSVFKEASQISELASFVKLLDGNGFSIELSTSETPITLLAPVDTAVQAISKNVTASLWPAILANHILDGNIYSSNIAFSVHSQNNATWNVNRIGNKLYIGGLLVLKSDVLGSNGVIHVINGVLGVTPSQL